MFPKQKGKMPRRREAESGVVRIPDTASPRGYREVCVTEAAWQRRRKLIAERAKGKCEKRNCNAPFPHGDAHHKDPRKAGGGSRDDHPDNLLWLCARCHRLEHVPAKVVPRKVIDEGCSTRTVAERANQQDQDGRCDADALRDGNPGQNSLGAVSGISPAGPGEEEPGDLLPGVPSGQTPVAALAELPGMLPTLWTWPPEKAR